MLVQRQSFSFAKYPHRTYFLLLQCTQSVRKMPLMRKCAIQSFCCCIVVQSGCYVCGFYFFVSNMLLFVQILRNSIADILQFIMFNHLRRFLQQLEALGSSCWLYGWNVWQTCWNFNYLSIAVPKFLNNLLMICSLVGIIATVGLFIGLHKVIWFLNCLIIIKIKFQLQRKPQLLLLWIAVVAFDVTAELVYLAYLTSQSIVILNFIIR